MVLVIVLVIAVLMIGPLLLELLERRLPPPAPVAGPVADGEPA